MKSQDSTARRVARLTSDGASTARRIAKLTIPEIRRASRVRVQAGDTLVLECDQTVSPQAADCIASYMKRMHEGVKVVVFDRGLRLRAVLARETDATAPSYDVPAMPL